MLATLLLLAGTALGEPGACLLTLTGTVTDAATNAPLAGARVVLERGASAVADERGAYRFEGMCPGPASLEASHPGHAPLRKELTLRDDGNILDLALPRTPGGSPDEEVEVVATEIPPLDTLATATLEGPALEQSSGKTLADTLAQVPGISVLRSGNTAKPIVRGQSGSRVLILYDGVRHESQDWGLEHAPEVDPFAAGSIEVVKGSAGVRYGPDAIAGVLLVDPHPLLDEPGLRADVQAIGALSGRRGTGAVRLDGAPGSVDGLAWRLEGNFSKGAALETPDYPLDNTGIEEWNAGAAARMRWDDSAVEVALRHNDLVNGICSCIRNDSPEQFFAQVENDQPNGVELYRVDYDIERPYQDVTHDLAMLRAGTRFAEVGELSSTYAFQTNRRKEYEIVRQAVDGPQFDFQLDTHTLDADFDHARVTLADGLALSGTWGMSGRFQENVYSGLPLIPNYRSYGAGVFGIERLDLDGVEISVGGRYDHLSQDAFLDESAYARHRARGTLEPDACTVAGEVASCPTSFDTGSVTLGGAMPLGDELIAKLDLSTASRFPTIDELYINGTAPTLPVLAIGDPSLGAETSYGASATLDLDAGWIAGQASVFGSFVDDYIYFAPELGPDGEPIFDVLVRGAYPRFTYRPVDATFWGGEASVLLRFEPFEVETRAAMVRGRDADSGAHLEWVPPDRYRVAITYRPPPIGVLVAPYATASGVYVAEQTRYDSTADLTEPPPAYALLGLGVGTEIELDGRRYRASIEVENLLDERYRDYTSLLKYFADEPGRQVFLRLGATVDLL